MYYPEEVIEEVRNSNDIVGVIGSVVNLTRKSGRYFGLCPFHNEKTGSFSVSPDKGLYHCFGCGVSGNVISFVMAYENYDFKEAVQYLADRAGITLPQREQTQEERRQADKKARMLELYKDAATYYYKQLRAPIGEKAREYFAGRRLSEETQAKFGLGYAPANSQPLYTFLKSKGYTDELIREANYLRMDERGVWDPFWNRAIFPIMDTRGRVIGFGGRVMGEGEPKYYNSSASPIFDKSRNLFGLNIAKSSRRPYMILCEGYMDVIALHQTGFDCAVASLGTAFTPGHATLLKRYVDEVYLTFDSDEAGTKAKLRAIPILKGAGLSVKVINMQPYKDPDEFIVNLGEAEFEERIKSATSSFFFETDVMQASYDMADPEKKTAFHKQLAAKLAAFTDTLERENYLGAVASRYEIPADYLREMVNYIGAQGMKYEVPLPSLTGAGVKKPERGQGAAQAERLVLNWVIGTDAAYDDILRYVKPEYFKDAAARRVAEYVFEKKAAGGVIDPAGLIDVLSADEEERAEISAILSAELPEEEAPARTVLVSNMKKIKKDFLNDALRSEMDPSLIAQYAREKSEIDRKPIDIV